MTNVPTSGYAHRATGCSTKTSGRTGNDAKELSTSRQGDRPVEKTAVSSGTAAGATSSRPSAGSAGMPCSSAAQAPPTSTSTRPRTSLPRNQCRMNSRVDTRSSHDICARRANSACRSWWRSTSRTSRSRPQPASNRSSRATDGSCAPDSYRLTVDAVRPARWASSRWLSPASSRAWRSTFPTSTARPCRAARPRGAVLRDLWTPGPRTGRVSLGGVAHSRMSAHFLRPSATPPGKRPPTGARGPCPGVGQSGRAGRSPVPATSPKKRAAAIRVDSDQVG